MSPDWPSGLAASHVPCHKSAVSVNKALSGLLIVTEDLFVLNEHNSFTLLSLDTQLYLCRNKVNYNWSLTAAGTFRNVNQVCQELSRSRYQTRLNTLHVTCYALQINISLEHRVTTGQITDVTKIITTDTQFIPVWSLGSYHFVKKLWSVKKILGDYHHRFYHFRHKFKISWWRSYI